MFKNEVGHSCILANDGVEALSILEKNTVDLIILDIMIPRLDGFTVCKFARNICDVPIIFLTAKGEENDKLKGFVIYGVLLTCIGIIVIKKRDIK